MTGIEYHHTLAQAIVDTIREPLLVLDEDLRVVAASRSFYVTFNASREQTEGQFLYKLGEGRWDVASLRVLLNRISPDAGVLNDYEIELDLPEVGARVMLLNARKVYYERGAHTTILLAFEDITDQRAATRERDALLADKELLLQEMQHRVANSLQIIASILLLKARSVTSEETRNHLQDAHKRVLAVAAVQKHLHATGGSEAIDLRPYLTQLCASLAGSMIGESRAITLRAEVEEGSASSGDAVSIGLIVTELVINALKYAFPARKAGGTIVVSYAARASGWKLSVVDDGIGKGDEVNAKGGLGTSIVSALASQLHARVESASSGSGLAMAIIHTTSLAPTATLEAV